MNNIKKFYITEGQYKLLCEERGVFPEVVEFSYKLAKEYIQHWHQQKSYIYYCSRYKFLGHRIYVTNSNSFACFIDDDGKLIIEIKPQNGLIKEDFIENITHEFTHSLQMLYSQEKSSGGNVKFCTDYLGMTWLYAFSYGEMQARLNSLVGIKSHSFEINKNSNQLLINQMKNVIDELKSLDNGELLNGKDKFEVMVSLSQQANKGFHFSNADTENDKHQFVSNNYPYLKNVTRDNYEKKYAILIRDFEKRYKWFLSRLYYWRDKLNNDRQDILDRNMRIDKDIENWKNRKEERERIKREKTKKQYIENYILNPKYKLYLNPRCYLGKGSYYGTLSNGKDTVDVIFGAIGKGLDKEIDFNSIFTINNFQIDKLPSEVWQVIVNKFNDSFNEFINGVDIDETY